MTANKIISLDRENMSETSRRLFLKDLQRVAGEYFETEGETSLEVTRDDDGFLVCVIFKSRRIKSVKTPV